MFRPIVAIFLSGLILTTSQASAGSGARTGAAAAPKSNLGGFGVIGDSYSDEYAFYSPDRASARNWVEILDRVRGLNFGGYSERSRGEPRNQGFAYNWARSDAETATMLRDGQHKGLAAQVASGEVAFVVVFAGGNDFIHALNSQDPDRALAEALPRALRNYRTLVGTIRDADPRVRMLLLTVPDLMELPEFREKLINGRLTPQTAERCQAAVKAFNKQVRAMGTSDDRMGLLDLNVMSRLTISFGQGKALVGGKVVDKVHPSNLPDHLFLADSRHMGTYGQGVFAKLIVDTLNVRFHAGIPPLSYQEIQSLANSPELFQRPDRLAASE